MKIFYAIQATGNGHISRAMELLPYLKQYGSVDLFLSGSNSNLELDVPVKYRSKGLTLFYNCNGGLDYFQLLRKTHPLRLMQEIRELPVEKYDLIINDFDYITAAACARKNIPSINFGHHASFQSQKTPRPARKSMIGETVLRKFARATDYVGLHFQRYDNFIFTPIIKKEILEAEPTDKNYITVYLPSYCEPQLIKIFQPFREFRFQVFCKNINQPKQVGNITLLPVQKKLFNSSLTHCTGIITGGGFETPAEALHLGKKMMCVPIVGQYEQYCNAAALVQMGIRCLNRIESGFTHEFHQWMDTDTKIEVNYANSLTESLEHVFSLHKKQLYSVPVLAEL